MPAVVDVYLAVGPDFGWRQQRSAAVLRPRFHVLRHLESAGGTHRQQHPAVDTQPVLAYRVQCAAYRRDGDLGEEADPAHVDAQDQRVVGRCQPCAAQEGAVAAEGHDQVRIARGLDLLAGVAPCALVPHVDIRARHLVLRAPRMHKASGVGRLRPPAVHHQAEPIDRHLRLQQHWVKATVCHSGHLPLGATRRQCTAVPSARITTMDTLDRIVSITDQDARVCLTSIPKNSLTSQNPASFTCEKNSEPEPMASASSGALTCGEPAAIGAMMPAAVTVATVAEPVASRIATATSQASSSRERCEPCAALPIESAIPVCTSICLNPPPAPMISRIPAIGASDSLSETPERARPSRNTSRATATAMAMAMIGSPTKSATLIASLFAGAVRSTTVRASMMRTGSRMTARVVATDGPARVSASAMSVSAPVMPVMPVVASRCPTAVAPAGSSVVAVAAAVRVVAVAPAAADVWPVVPGPVEVSPAGRAAGFGAPAAYCSASRAGGSGTIRREMKPPNTGPARIAVGIATMTPSSSVVPRSACSAEIAISGPGCGGIRPCRMDRPASAGMPTRRIEPPVRRQTRYTIGTSSTRPTSKNIGMPMIIAASAIDHGTQRGPVWPTRALTSRCAPFESTSSRPSIAPSATMTPTPPSTPPTPVSKVGRILETGTPALKATSSVPAIRARNGCTLATAVSSTTRAIPPKAHSTSRVSELVHALVAAAGAAESRGFMRSALR